MDNIKESRERFVKKVLDAIPSHLKPVEYLMEILNISSVSVYRRINCKVPFTYDEMVILSSKLGFSSEEIFNSASNDRAVFMIQDRTGASFQEYFLNVLKGYYENLEKETKAENRKAILSMNNVWLIHTLGTDNLLKFIYYKWFLQMSPVSFKCYMEDVHIPASILEQRDKITHQLQVLTNTTFIIDRLVYFNTMQDIQYYYRRKLINKKELLLIAEDLRVLMDYAEKQIVKGTYSGVTHYFYLSYLNLYSNSIYVECDDSVQSFFYEYNIRPLRTTNKKVCDAHKNWLESLKKDSVLISASNEILQMDFFNKQNKYLNDLIKDKDLIP